MPKERMSDDDIKQAAITLLRQEKTAWEEAQTFVTERIMFRMKYLVRQLRKNYYGIFDDKLDPLTGREKTWVPLTESIVEAAVKNADLDTKDINIRAKKPESIGLASLVRNIVKNKLDIMYFGEYLDEMVRNLCIDGTAVWKTIEELDQNGKVTLRILPVDLLNFFIDPTAHNIQDTPAVIERAVLTKDQFMGMDGWTDKEDVLAVDNVPNYDRLYAKFSHGKTKMVEVFERWGKMPKSLITGVKADEDTYIEGHIVCSSLSRGAKVHLIEENTHKDSDGIIIKPYEEAWYTRVPGRWYGKGPAEKVMMLQLWLNTIVNIRINRSMVSQLGIFKIKKGKGITPQMVSRLAANGAISVNDMDDIQQLVMTEASSASYQDEASIQTWAERVTSVFETVTGEQLPASTPATNAVLQARQAQSAFVLLKEGIGMFLQRWMNRHALPILIKGTTRAEVVRLTGDVEELRDLDDRIANHLLYEKLDEMNKAGQIFDLDQVETERQRILHGLSRMGKDRYFSIKDKIDVAQYDVEVFVTNEEVDKSVMVQNLLSMLQTVAQLPQSGIDPVQVARTIFDVMGLDSADFNEKPKPPQPQAPFMPGGQAFAPGQTPILPQGGQMPQQAPNQASSDAQQLQRITTGANTLAKAANLPQ